MNAPHCMQSLLRKSTCARTRCGRRCASSLATVTMCRRSPHVALYWRLQLSRRQPTLQTSGCGTPRCVLVHLGEPERRCSSACAICSGQCHNSAAVRLWDNVNSAPVAFEEAVPGRQVVVCCMQTWACVGRLAAHTLSVTQLAFSHDGRHLLSGSRDRSFAVFRRQDNPQPGENIFDNM
jgi:WD40 repeat protein